jgi:hypothetical protein
MYKELLSDHIDTVKKLSSVQVVIKVFDEKAKDILLIATLHIVRNSHGQLKHGTFGTAFSNAPPIIAVKEDDDDIIIYAADKKDNKILFPVVLTNVDWVDYL